MIIDLLKGVIIGIVCGVPIGAAGAMTIQRTLKFGVKQGLLTGLGSSVADCIYAGVGVFGLTFISDFLTAHSSLINLVGGSFAAFMGFNVLRKKETSCKPEKGIRLFLSSFTIGITNPVAIIAFLIAFSYMNVQRNMGLINSFVIILGVFIGTYIWWGTIAYTVCLIKKKAKKNILNKLNVIFCCILITFGFLMILKGTVNLFKTLS